MVKLGLHFIFGRFYPIVNWCRQSSYHPDRFKECLAIVHCRCRFLSSKQKYPAIVEDELEEKFTRGSGPGGQATNKTSNCVLLKHVPTGIVIKCHAERSLELNRKIARRRLQEALDAHFNGENAVKALENIDAIKRKAKKKAKTRKKLEMLASDKNMPDGSAEEELMKLNSDVEIPSCTSHTLEKKDTPMSNLSSDSKT